MAGEFLINDNAKAKYYELMLYCCLGEEKKEQEEQREFQMIKISETTEEGGWKSRGKQNHGMQEYGPLPLSVLCPDHK
ncbi:unnamed protein product [Dovyalis caffra]|uniref:Uncharacterized protein n=1 Tax=Dovyalis caffra TaxID=77055 RepID=A0AAV1STM7_9ROSI|nr:unnamed protein product [Dovyalis caffra]